MSNNTKNINREEVIRKAFDKGQQYGIDYSIHQSEDTKEDAVLDCMEDINDYLENL